MFNRKKMFYYESYRETYPNIINQSKQFIPEWYKKIPKWRGNKMWTPSKGFRPTVKDCSPFLESLMAGYMLVLPYDVYVGIENGVPIVTWKTHSDLEPGKRDELSDTNLVPAGHYPIEFTWRPNGSFVVPKGYSILLTHPFNRHDLPFTTLTGIIDGDFIVPPFGNIPFFVKKDFEGVIPQGTPIAQLLPFRQESWQSEIKNGLRSEGEKNTQRTTAVFSGWYKQNIWYKKQFN